MSSKRTGKSSWPSIYRQFICTLASLIVLLSLGTAIAELADLRSFDIQIYAAEDFTIDKTKKKQIIDGFGASTAFYDEWIWTSLQNLGLLEDFLDHVFSPTEGIGLSILRSKFEHKTSIAPGVYDWQRLNYIGEMMKAAQERGVTRLFTTAFSVPSWMKTEDNRLKTEHYQDLAVFMADYITHLKNTFGVNMHVISVSNEPDIDNRDPEHTVFHPDQIRDYVKVLGPVFDTRGIETGIMVTESFRWFSEWYAKSSLQDAQAIRHLDKIGAHAYTYVDWLVDFELTKQEHYRRVQNGEGSLRVWQTEGGGIEMDPDTSIDDGILWAKEIHKYLTDPRIEASAWLYWWLMSQNQGARNVLVGFDGQHLSYHKRFYTMGNYSKLVRPGYSRIEVSPNSQNNVYISAFISPDENSIVIIAVNDNDEDTSLNINLPGPYSIATYITSATKNLEKDTSPIIGQDTFSYDLPAKSVVTFLSTYPDTTPTPRSGDINADGNVDGLDYSIFYQNWDLTIPPGDPRCDFNHDARVDSLDYLTLYQNWDPL